MRSRRGGRRRPRAARRALLSRRAVRSRRSRAGSTSMPNPPVRSPLAAAWFPSIRCDDPATTWVPFWLFSTTLPTITFAAPDIWIPSPPLSRTTHSLMTEPSPTTRVRSSEPLSHITSASLSNFATRRSTPEESQSLTIPLRITPSLTGFATIPVEPTPRPSSVHPLRSIVTSVRRDRDPVAAGRDQVADHHVGAGPRDRVRDRRDRRARVAGRRCGRGVDLITAAHLREHPDRERSDSDGREDGLPAEIRASLLRGSLPRDGSGS